MGKKRCQKYCWRCGSHVQFDVLGVVEDDPGLAPALVVVVPHVPVGLGVGRGPGGSPGTTGAGRWCGSARGRRSPGCPACGPPRPARRRRPARRSAGWTVKKSADVVAAVAQRRRVERQQPEAVDAQPLQVVEPLGEAPQVAAAVAAGVVEAPHEDLVEHRPLVPPRVVRPGRAIGAPAPPAGATGASSSGRESSRNSQRNGGVGRQPAAGQPGGRWCGPSDPMKETPCSTSTILRRPTAPSPCCQPRRRADQPARPSASGPSPSRLRARRDGCWSTCGASPASTVPASPRWSASLRAGRAEAADPSVWPCTTPSMVDAAPPAEGLDRLFPAASRARRRSGLAIERSLEPARARPTTSSSSPTGSPSSAAPATGHWETSPGGLVRAMLGTLRQPPRRVGGLVAARPTTRPRRSSTTASTSCPCALSRRRRTQGFYDGFANETLWPLYHDAIRASTFEPAWWETYVRVNERFAEAAAARGRARAPSCGCTTTTCSWCLPCSASCAPTCASASSCTSRSRPQELFMRLPWREEILRGPPRRRRRRLPAPGRGRELRAPCAAGCSTRRRRARLDPEGRPAGRTSAPSRSRSTWTSSTRSPARPRPSSTRGRSCATASAIADVGAARRRPPRLHEGHRRAPRGLPRRCSRSGELDRRGTASWCRSPCRPASRSSTTPTSVARSSSSWARSTASSAASATRPSTTCTRACRSTSSSPLYQAARRHARDAAARRHEPRGQGVRGQPHRRRRCAGAQ